MSHRKSLLLLLLVIIIFTPVHSFASKIEDFRYSVTLGWFRQYYNMTGRGEILLNLIDPIEIDLNVSVSGVGMLGKKIPPGLQMERK